MTAIRGLRAPHSQGATNPHVWGPPAPCKRAGYRCGRGHAFDVTFADDAEPPDLTACRCGSPAKLAGTPAAPAGQSEHERRMVQVRGRRADADLENLLAEALADLGHSDRHERTGP